MLEKNSKVLQHEEPHMPENLVMETIKVHCEVKET
jgi:hypothetical protein